MRKEVSYVCSGFCVNKLLSEKSPVGKTQPIALALKLLLFLLPNKWLFSRQPFLHLRVFSDTPCFLFFLSRPASSAFDIARVGQVAFIWRDAPESVFNIEFPRTTSSIDPHVASI